MRVPWDLKPRTQPRLSSSMLGHHDGERNIGESIDLNCKLDVVAFRCSKATMTGHRNPELIARIKIALRRCPISSFRSTGFPARPIALAGNEPRLGVSRSGPGEP